MNEANQNIKRLPEFVKSTWDGDVSYEEATNQLSRVELIEAELLLINNPDYIQGLPMPGDDAYWDKLSTTPGGVVLQRIVDKIEGTSYAVQT